jgi:hypothetical protein
MTAPASPRANGFPAATSRHTCQHRVCVHGAGLAVTLEFPSNNLGLTIEAANNFEITLYFNDIEQWWRLRQVLPKAPGYVYAASSAASLISDIEVADAMALHFYEEAKAAARSHRPRSLTEAEIPF